MASQQEIPGLPQFPIDLKHVHIILDLSRCLCCASLMLIRMELQLQLPQPLSPLLRRPLVHLVELLHQPQPPRCPALLHLKGLGGLRRRQRPALGVRQAPRRVAPGAQLLRVAVLLASLGDSEAPREPPPGTSGTPKTWPRGNEDQRALKRKGAARLESGKPVRSPMFFRQFRLATRSVARPSAFTLGQPRKFRRNRHPLRVMGVKAMALGAREGQ